MGERKTIFSKCGYKCDLCPAHESNLKTEADKKIMCDAWNKYIGGRYLNEIRKSLNVKEEN